MATLKRKNANGDWDLLQLTGEEVSNIQTELETVNTQLAQIAINVKSYGAKGDGVTNDSQAILNALAVSKNLYFPDGTYLITFTGSFYTFTNQSNIRFKGKGATIKDGNTYSVDSLTNIFQFTNCSNIDIDVNFDALPIASPHTMLGYRGSSALYFEKNCSFIKVNSIMNNFRYGVRSGNYTDATLGYCSNFDLRLKTYGTGYPVAFYLSDSIKVDIQAEESHRIAYFAGCNDIRGNISYKGFVLANQNILLTNSLTSAETSIQANQRARGCTNVDLNITDNGSTCDQPSRSIAGIGLQWVCLGTKYENIKLNLQATTDDTSRTLGAFSVLSGAKTYRPEYGFNWEPYIVFRNITISGSIDRSAQTLGNSSWGDLYIMGLDFDDVTYTHAPTFSNINFSDLTIIKGAAAQNTNVIRMPKLADTLTFERVLAEGINFSISAQQGKTRVISSKMGIINSLDTIAELIQEDSVISSIIAGVVTKQVLRNMKPTVKGDEGYTYLESGIIMQWKKVYYTNAVNTDLAVTLPIAFPNGAMSAQLTTLGASSIIATLNGLTTSAVTIRCNTQNTTIYILAFGY